MLNKRKLSTKFTVLLSVVFVVGIIASSLVLWQVLYTRAQSEINSRGEILIKTMSAVRGYTSTHINPLLSKEIANQPQFISETVPAFSARQVFDGFRTNPEYASFLYKEATLNPTVEQDKADGFERSVVDQMRTDASLKELSGFRALSDSQVYYIARPLAVTSDKCLTCHSDPAIAPKSLIATYGSQNGFGWKLNEVVGSQIIYVPADEVFKATTGAFLLIMGIFVAIFACAIVLINFLLQRYVIQSVSVLDKLALSVRTDKMVPNDMAADKLAKVAARGDELGALAQVFRQMALDVYSRTQTLKQQVAELHIEIDEIKREKEVQSIVETDFFRDLQAKANILRARRSPKPDAVYGDNPAAHSAT